MFVTGLIVGSSSGLRVPLGAVMCQGGAERGRESAPALPTLIRVPSAVAPLPRALPNGPWLRAHGSVPTALRAPWAEPRPRSLTLLPGRLRVALRSASGLRSAPPRPPCPGKAWKGPFQGRIAAAWLPSDPLSRGRGCCGAGGPGLRVAQHVLVNAVDFHVNDPFPVLTGLDV